MRALRLMMGLVASVGLATGTVAASDITVALTTKQGKPLVAGRTPAGDPVPVSGKVKLHVTCDNSLECAKVTASLSKGTKPITSFAQLPAEFEAQAATIKLSHDGAPIDGGTFAMKVESGGAESGEDASAKASDDEPTVAELALARCTNAVNVAYTPYDRRADVATFLVRPNGQVIDGPTENVDEDDRVEVVVWAPEAVASTLRIRRISPIRNPTFRILGAGTDLSPLVTKLADLEARCIPVRAVLSDFEPPRGEVQISTLAGGAEVVLGSFEFVVDPLYNGILSFGAVRTKLINQGFALAPKGEEKIIVPTEEGQWATRYAVFFTPYVWEARDPVKGPRKWFHRFNPLVGITTDHIGDNAIFGASVDLGPIQAIGGWHLSHVADLSPDSGLTVGGPFTGEASAIPTVKSWKSSTFFGISLDVRAAAALLKTVLGSGGGS